MSAKIANQLPPHIPLFRGFQREQISCFFDRIDTFHQFIPNNIDSEKINLLESYLASEAKRWYSKINWNDWYDGKPAGLNNPRPPKDPVIAATYTERKNYILKKFPFHSRDDRCLFYRHLKQGPWESPKHFYDRIIEYSRIENLENEDGLLESLFVDGLYPHLRIYVPQIISKKVPFTNHVNRTDRKFYRDIRRRDQSTLKSKTHVKWTGVLQETNETNEKNGRIPPMGSIMRLKQGKDESPWDYFIRLGDACEYDGIDVDASRRLLFYRGLTPTLQDEQQVWNAANLEDQVAFAQHLWMQDYWQNRHGEAHREFAETRCVYEHVEEIDYQFLTPRYSILPVNGGMDRFFYDFMQPNVVADPAFNMGGEPGCVVC